MGVKIKIIILLVILLLSIISVSAQLSEVEEAIQKEGKARVIVILKPEEKKAFSIFGEEKTPQEKVLDTLNLKEKKVLGLFTVEPDFNLRNTYSEVSAFAGEITYSGLSKLKDNPNVEGIYLDKKAHTMLQQSVPLINADDVWSKQANGVHLTGEGQTVCIVDTGVDYRHPAIGSSQCAKGGWQVDGTPENYPYSFYSGSPSDTKPVTMPGYSNIAVHFSTIHTVKGESIIYIKDTQGNIIQAYSGDYTNEWTFSIPGNSINIEFQGPPGHGYTIDKVVNGFTRVVWQNCGDFIGGYDAVDFDHDPMDGNGHGTHVAGIITSDDSTYKGVAPDAKIVAVKALADDGWGYDSAVIGGIDGCIRYADVYNISVISLSLGGDTLYNNYCESSSYTSFINKAAQKGIFVAAASGNDNNPSNICEPACVNKATPVGSTDKNDQISDFSNRWSLPILFAPGSSIRSTDLNTGFTYKSGTSMSTPHVSGVAALVYQYAELKGIEITPQEIEDLLIQTGKQIDGDYKRVDALAAIEELQKISFNISLRQGWNLISIPLILENDSVKNVFAGISYSKIFYYNSGWKNATKINNTFGYWIDSNNNQLLKVEGLPPENISTSLKSGWNLIGYPYLNETSISLLFNNVTVFMFNNSRWYSYDSDRSPELNTLNKFTPGFGYWVKTE